MPGQGYPCLSLCLLKDELSDLCVNRFPHIGHSNIYLAPTLSVLLLWGALTNVLRVGSNIVPRFAGGAEIGPEAVNSTAYRGIKGVFVT